MTTSVTTLHAGIELDVIDFSVLNRHSPFSVDSDTDENKIDHKAFIKMIYSNIMKNDHFLSFSNQIRDVNQILKMKYSSASDIANVILKDMALTTKLLKLVNSSFYGHFSNKKIATISEAMIILGTEEIKLAAASLKIYELLKDVANVKILKDKALKSLQRSIMARRIATDENIKDEEAIQITAMLYEFGEYLVALFSPNVYINIEILVD
ncbi:MAG: HDOD domain-containing protein, partial [Desulfobacula sp.]